MSLIDTRKFKILTMTKFGFEVNELSWNKSGNLFFLTTGQGQVEVRRHTVAYPSAHSTGTLNSTQGRYAALFRCMSARAAHSTA